MRMESKERSKSSRPSVAALVKGYVGFLVGTGKSSSTISSYKGDLELFEKFLREKKRDFYRLQPRDIESYQVWLEKAGMKTNTRRRKVLSAKALVKYAVSRKKLQPGHAVQFVKTPERLERLPWIPSPGDFEKILGSVNTQTQTGLRNWLVVSLLAETGMTIAELCGLRWDACGEGFVSVEGKRTRRLAISAFAATRLLDWRSKISAPSSSSSLRAGKYLFPGFNQIGRAHV